ncbi:hypothetical protein ACHWQZ_G008433 [Mnemiopsis leidyi]
MSQTTLTYRVRKSRPQTTKTDQVRNYPKRERKQTPSNPSVTFTAVPLKNGDPVLKPLDDVTRKENVGVKQRCKEDVFERCEKSPGKRLCIEPPASPRSVSPSKRKCGDPGTPTKTARVPLSCITPTKTPQKTPSKFSQLKFQSPLKTSAKLTPKKALFSPGKSLKPPSITAHLSEHVVSSDSLKSPIKSPAKIIRNNLKSPFKSPYKQPKVVPNPSLLPQPQFDSTVLSRKKLLQQKLAKSRAGSSPALKSAKKHLQSCSTPDRLIGRESEVSELEKFIRCHVTDNTPGSLYVSGAPGTGKTASLSHILSKLKEELSFSLIEINCMSHNTNKALYADIATQLNCDKTTKSACQSFITSRNRRKMIVMLLDEVDQLETSSNSVLYTLFEWPALPNSRLILIGIANALDLTDRQLPRLKAQVSCQPELIHFAPYNKEQIVSIIQHRLQQVPDGVMDPGAIQFCARKISVITGDIRKALDICRRAIELVEMKGQEGGKVTIPYISKVVQEVYGGQIQNQLSGKTSESTLPLQQQLLLCSVAIGTNKKHGAKSDTITAAKLHSTLTKVCADRSLQCPDFSEFVDLISMLESRGLVSVKSHKEKRLQKVSLRIQPKELEIVLEDKTLLSTIMDSASKFC